MNPGALISASHPSHTGYHIDAALFSHPQRPPLPYVENRPTSTLMRRNWNSDSAQLTAGNEDLRGYGRSRSIWAAGHVE